MGTARTVRLISLGVALVFLSYLFWGVETESSENRRLKRLVDNSLDRFASQLLSNVTSQMPGDLANAFNIQSFLSCLIRKAEWRDTKTGPNLTLMPSACSSILNQNLSLTFRNVEEICQLLPGTRLLLVGPETTHLLHSLWLDLVESRRNRTHTCPGRNYCTFHHICQSPSTSPEWTDINDRAERKQKLPSNNLLRATRSSLLQYTYSTTLHAGEDQSDIRYQFPLVDLETGVPQVSQYWLRRARRADVVVLSRAPIPAPIWTYTSGSAGNWTFASALCNDQYHVSVFYCKFSLPYTLAIAALDVTLRDFLPSVMETIGKMASDNSLQAPRHVWHGNWFIQPSCAVKGLPRDIQLLPDFWSCADLVDSCHQMDPWTYFYNIQGMLGSTTVDSEFRSYSMLHSLSTGSHSTPDPSLLWNNLFANDTSHFRSRNRIF